MPASSKKTSSAKASSAKTSAEASTKAPVKKSSKVSADAKIVLVAEQPRRKGTKAYKLYAEMAKFVGRRKVAVEEVFENTHYRPIDLKWDVAHGFVKLGR